MFCKWCGADLSPRAARCTQCGREVPPKSDCGGFFDLPISQMGNTHNCEPVQAPPVQVPVDTMETITMLKKANARTRKNFSRLTAIMYGCFAVVIVFLVVLLIKVWSLSGQVDELKEQVESLKKQVKEITVVDEGNHEETKPNDPGDSGEHTDPSSPSQSGEIPIPSEKPQPSETATEPVETLPLPTEIVDSDVLKYQDVKINVIIDDKIDGDIEGDIIPKFISRPLAPPTAKNLEFLLAEESKPVFTFKADEKGDLIQVILEYDESVFGKPEGEPVCVLSYQDDNGKEKIIDLEVEWVDDSQIVITFPAEEIEQLSMEKIILTCTQTNEDGGSFMLIATTIPEE